MRKLKPDRGIQGLVPAIVSLVLFFFTAIVFNLSTAFNILGGLMIIYSFIFGFWSFYKSGNYYFLISTFYLLTFGLVLILLDLPEDFNGPEPKFTDEMKVALLFFYVFMFWLMYVGYQKKLKYRGREVMELAAWDVEEGPDTYTERPRPAGMVDFGKYDIIDFGNYLKKILACYPFQEENRVVMVPIKYGDEFELLYKPNFNYHSKTWIAFDFNGQVSVHISRKDYLDYKDDLSFDHLCESLGQLMITFARFYMRGDKVRIIDRLNSVKIGLFS
ncbi:hypothetical protein OU798_24515 [Prolixibacteraceae bacterium Z1-6]|uniref:Uncharacterized protein n=1 Tax=Draconibacterium aestuarii TaxID=2998507 RepID=A0A9X3J8H5_9BACT|nr:hypothetical protein [Prolixibacteraceae bacterium Z1-6]